MGSKKKNDVRPTKRQISTFEHMKKAESLRDAMIAGGYSEESADDPKHNLTESRGFQILMEQYRGDLQEAGLSTKMMAEIQVEGLLDQDPKVRLDYLKETKKDLGLFQPDNKPVNIAIGILPKKDYEW